MTHPKDENDPQSKDTSPNPKRGSSTLDFGLGLELELDKVLDQSISSLDNTSAGGILDSILKPSLNIKDAGGRKAMDATQPMDVVATPQTAEYQDSFSDRTEPTPIPPSLLPDTEPTPSQPSSAATAKREDLSKTQATPFVPATQELHLPQEDDDDPSQTLATPIAPSGVDIEAVPDKEEPTQAGPAPTSPSGVDIEAVPDEDNEKTQALPVVPSGVAIEAVSVNDEASEVEAKTSTESQEDIGAEVEAEASEESPEDTDKTQAFPTVALPSQDDVEAAEAADKEELQAPLSLASANEDALDPSQTLTSPVPVMAQEEEAEEGKAPSSSEQAAVSTEGPGEEAPQDAVSQAEAAPSTLPPASILPPPSLTPIPATRLSDTQPLPPPTPSPNTNPYEEAVPSPQPISKLLESNATMQLGLEDIVQAAELIKAELAKERTLPRLDPGATQQLRMEDVLPSHDGLPAQGTSSGSHTDLPFVVDKDEERATIPVPPHTNPAAPPPPTPSPLLFANRDEVLSPPSTPKPHTLERLTPAPASLQDDKVPEDAETSSSPSQNALPVPPLSQETIEAAGPMFNQGLPTGEIMDLADYQETDPDLGAKTQKATEMAQTMMFGSGGPSLEDIQKAAEAMQQAKKEADSEADTEPGKEEEEVTAASPAPTEPAVAPSSSDADASIPSQDGVVSIPTIEVSSDAANPGATMAYSGPSLNDVMQEVLARQAPGVTVQEATSGEFDQAEDKNEEAHGSDEDLRITSPVGAPPPTIPEFEPPSPTDIEPMAKREKPMSQTVAYGQEEIGDALQQAMEKIKKENEAKAPATEPEKPSKPSVRDTAVDLDLNDPENIPRPALRIRIDPPPGENALPQARPQENAPMADFGTVSQQDLPAASSSRLPIILIAVLLTLLLAGGAAWYFLR
ncbi:MAG: hypothetical protein EP343_04370 [Deltaproteobacteria bacterium]|nr:MAG: hypothetical protein EP343_04370 [Deltaproteobacteria bacterium]